MAELGKRGLLYLDDGSSARSAGARAGAEERRALRRRRHRRSTPCSERGAILKKLDELERTARAKGFAHRHRLGLRRDGRRGRVMGRRGQEARHRDRADLGRRHRSRRRGWTCMAKTSTVDPETLPYRPCVGIMVLNREGLVWAGRRIAEPDSEMAGTDAALADAAGRHRQGRGAASRRRVRELYEETGMRRVIAARRGAATGSTTTCRRIWSASRFKGKYRGQTQKWFAFRFEGDESEIAHQPAARRPHGRIRRLGMEADGRAAGPDRALQAQGL